MRDLRVIAWCSAVVVSAGLGLLDLRLGTFTHWSQGLFGLVTALVAVAAALTAPWLGPRALPGVAGAVGGAVLGSTAAQGQHPDGTVFAATATGALLGLLAMVAWRGLRWYAVVVSPLLMAVVISQPLVPHRNDTRLILALALALAAFFVAAGGLAARLVGISRQRQEIAVRLAQRAEFARDLHDYVAHHVTGIVLLAQGARAISGKQPQLVPPALERIEEAGAEAINTMRRMVGLLRDTDSEAPLAPSPTVADIERLVGEFATGVGPSARLALEGTFDDVAIETQSTVHRVVMEGLTNIRKHAGGATDVEVLVRRSSDWITTRVSDDGRARLSTGGGFGLRGLTERVDALGGTIQAGPAPTGGWVVEARLPARGKQ
ncbi:histidine kinase [Micromonospora sp. NPDC023737]|uniref:sensor histidine kinase n=1 Tax=unclassified Micromonospora TaxID=2617518 RepID=UPI0033E35B85